MHLYGIRILITKPSVSRFDRSGESLGSARFSVCCAGIAWAIDQKSARRRFLVWSIMGVVIGFILSMASYRAEPMIVFSLAGVYVGGVTALNRLGVYKVEER